MTALLLRMKAFLRGLLKNLFPLAFYAFTFVLMSTSATIAFKEITKLEPIEICNVISKIRFL